MASDDVAAAITLELFSRTKDPLFHSMIPCCNHFGRC
jgi:hypothetical protein